VPSRPLVRMFIYGAIASAIGIAIVLAIDWFPPAASTDAHRIDNLYDLLIIVSVPIFVLVMAVAIYSVTQFRARPGDTGDGAPIHGNAKLEVIWVLIPFLIVSALAAEAWHVLHEIEKPKPGEMRVHVFGQQFAWSYEYTGPGGKPIRSSDLYLPVNKPIRFDISARDVIHSFWIPTFRLKSDAVPGITTRWRTTPNKIGDQTIVCAELCGAGHSEMRSTAHVVSQADFDKWLAKAGGGPAPIGGGAGAQSGRPGAAGSGTGDGKAVFAQNGCGGCHQLTAAGSNGTVGPSLDNLVADARANGKGKTPAAYVRESILSPDAVIVPGFPKGTMPQTFGKDLTKQQIDALVAFLLKPGGGGGGG
jgi:cytochrome c oxidase subunit 2